MRALDRKLLRNLRQIWAQTLAIALVLGCGVMVFVGSDSTQRTLSATQDAYYDRQRFADIWAGATRVPRSLLDQIALIDGVAQVDGRIAFSAVLDIDGMDEPASARIVSVAPDGTGLNLPILRRGRLPDPARPDEVAVNEPFGEAHDLLPGSRFRGVLNGQLRELVVTGWVLSPEFVYAIAPGTMMPDNRRYGILWMGEPAAAAVQDMTGAVNEISLRLARGAEEAAVIAALDDLLEPYGGTGSHGRDLQSSHAFLKGEMQQLQAMARYVPPIFLVISAFLVNMVLGRLIAQERVQIGLLKALGYSTGTIAWHYLKLALLIGGVGIVTGWAFGWWMGSAMIHLYADFFRFPFILRDPGQAALVISALTAMATVLIGGWRAVRASVRLPPAEAMQPPAPPLFSRGRTDRMIGALRLRQTSMMILRSILRWPGRAAITLFGVSASVGVLVMSYFLFDAVNMMAESLFEQANRQQVTLTLSNAAPARAVQDAMTLPGVMRAEGAHVVPVRLVNGHRTRLSVLQGHFEGAELARLVDDDGQVIPLPDNGVVLPLLLAQALEAEVGTWLDIELLVAPRETLTMPVTAVIRQGMGQEAHIAAPALFTALRVAPQVNVIHLGVDPDELGTLNARIKTVPAVAGLSDWAEVRRQFDATLSENLLVMVSIYTLIGALIAVGVIYNAARIQLSERSHELATLRVLGFTRFEVGFVLVGEMLLLTLLAIPVGWVVGYWLAAGLVGAMSTDLIQLPFQITRRTYALAAVVALVASTMAVLLVRRRLDRVDLVSALKARD